MKSQLLKVKRALAGESATTLESRMVKIQSGRLWAYGGTFCLSVPMESDLDVGFLPEPVLAFYSLARENEVITVREGKLKITSGKRSLIVSCLPASRIPVIDVLGGRVEATLNVDNLRRAFSFQEASCTDGNFFGVTLREGSFYSGSHQSMFAGFSGLPEDVNLRLPPGSVEALLAVKSPVSAIFRDQGAMRFDFEDGTRLTSRILEDLLPRTMDAVFSHRGPAVTFTEEAVEETMKFPCGLWELNGSAIYHYEENLVMGGELEGALEPDAPAVFVSHKHLSLLLPLSRTLLISAQMLTVLGEDFAAVVAQRRAV